MGDVGNLMRSNGTNETFWARPRCVALTGLSLHGGLCSQGGALRLSPRRSALGWFVGGLSGRPMRRRDFAPSGRPSSWMTFRTDFAPKGQRQISPGQSEAAPWVGGRIMRESPERAKHERRGTWCGRLARTQRWEWAALCRPYRASGARWNPYPGRRSAAIAAAGWPGGVGLGPLRAGADPQDTPPRGAPA